MAEHIPLNNVQTYVYSTLTNDATLQALGVVVRDYAGLNLALPAVTIGQYTQETSGTKGVPVSDVTFDVECWSNASGMKELNQIMTAAAQALTASEPSLSGGYEATVGTVDLAQALVEVGQEGEEIRHGIVQIRWHVAYTG